VPIPKVGQDPHTTEGYRPISLLNTMIKIIVKWLIIDSYGISKNIIYYLPINTASDKIDPLTIYLLAYTLISPMH